LCVGYWLQGLLPAITTTFAFNSSWNGKGHESEGLVGTWRIEPHNFKLEWASVISFNKSLHLFNAHNVSIPDRYDLREEYPYCSAIRRVMSQGSCGSCYAFASTWAASAAVCIASAGADDAVFSTQDLLACSSFVPPAEALGCYGGFVPDALLRLGVAGAVSESCVPYTAGDTWRNAQYIEHCRRTCSMEQGTNPHPPPAPHCPPPPPHPQLALRSLRAAAQLAVAWLAARPSP
jgi:hypothetical protein